MENELLKIYKEFSSHIELGMSKDIQAFLEGEKDIQDFDITADENEVVIINIKLRKFSEIFVKKMFVNFISFVGYNGINLFIRNNSTNKVKYLYYTALQEAVGVKMEITIE